MENTTTIKLELGIDATRFVQQVKIRNESIENSIEKGIQLAMDDLLEEDNFIQSIRQATKQELENIVNKNVLTWEVKNNIQKLISEKVGKKIEEYADKISEKLTNSLK